MEESLLLRLPISPLSLINDLFRPLTSKPTASSSFISDETDEEKKLRIETFANTNVAPEVVESPEVLEDLQEVAVDSEVKVVHVKRKRSHTRKKDHRLQKASSAPASLISLISVDSSASLLSPLSSESSGYRSVSEDKQCAEEGINGSSLTPCKGLEETVVEGDIVPEIKTLDIRTEPPEEKLSHDERLRRILEDNLPVEKQEVCFSWTIEWKTGKEQSPPKTTVMFSSNEATDKSSAEMTMELPLSSLMTSLQNSNSCERFNAVKIDNVAEQPSTDAAVAEADLVASVEEPSIYDDVPVSVKDAIEHPLETVGDVAVPSTFSSPVTLGAEVLADEMQREIESAALVFTEAKTNHEDCSVVQTKVPKVASTFQADKRHAADIEVDNNLKVVLMLEIFLHEDESLFKMFQTCQGHTEGEVSVTYVIITSHYLYLLKPSCKPNKFIREVAISFKELDYVSINLNHQILHIAYHVRHNQFWLTTGDEVLTRLIVSHLEQAVLLAGDIDSSTLSPLTVGLLKNTDH